MNEHGTITTKSQQPVSVSVRDRFMKQAEAKGSCSSSWSRPVRQRLFQNHGRKRERGEMVPEVVDGAEAIRARDRGDRDSPTFPDFLDTSNLNLAYEIDVQCKAKQRTSINLQENIRERERERERERGKKKRERTKGSLLSRERTKNKGGKNFFPPLFRKKTRHSRTPSIERARYINIFVF